MNDNDLLLQWLKDYFDSFKNEIVKKIDDVAQELRIEHKEVKEEHKHLQLRVLELERWKIYAGMILGILLLVVGIKFVPVDILLKLALV